MPLNINVIGVKMKIHNDISRCVGEGCIDKNLCARHVAWAFMKGDEGTLVSVAMTLIDEEGVCHSLIPVHKPVCEGCE